MVKIIQYALQLLNNISEIFNRESFSYEKIKDNFIKSSKDLKKAIFYANQIFDGKRKFEGLDVLLKGKLEEKDYETYLRLRQKFNKYSKAS